MWGGVRSSKTTFLPLPVLEGEAIELDVFTEAAAKDNFVASHQETESQVTNPNGFSTMMLRLSSKKNVLRQNKSLMACIIEHDSSRITKSIPLRAARGNPMDERFPTATCYVPRLREAT